jgi:hypothetical protein
MTAPFLKYISLFCSLLQMESIPVLADVVIN